MTTGGFDHHRRVRRVYGLRHPGGPLDV